MIFLLKVVRFSMANNYGFYYFVFIIIIIIYTINIFFIYVFLFFIYFYIGNLKMTNAVLIQLCSFVHKTRLDFAQSLIWFVVVKVFYVFDPKRHHQVPYTLVIHTHGVQPSYNNAKLSGFVASFITQFIYKMNKIFSFNIQYV